MKVRLEIDLFTILKSCDETYVVSGNYDVMLGNRKVARADFGYGSSNQTGEIKKLHVTKALEQKINELRQEIVKAIENELS